MKRVLSLMLAMILLLCSVTVVGAFSPVSPEENVANSFSTYHMNVAGGYIRGDIRVFGMYNFISGMPNPTYMLVKYHSVDAVEEQYFNRFGVNDEYYEYSEVTNLLYGSGITFFYGDTEEPFDETSGIFYSLDELTEIEPRAVDWAIYFLGPDYVGKIGDADKDGEVSVIDATAILRSEARLDTMTVELIGDIDGDGELSVLDATAIQQRLANAE